MRGSFDVRDSKRRSTITFLSQIAAERPVLFKDEGSIVWQLAAAIVVRFQDLNSRGGIDQIGFNISDIQPNTQNIIAWKQRQAGDFADHYLRTDNLRVIQTRLK